VCTGLLKAFARTLIKFKLMLLRSVIGTVQKQ
jgi:hypothetical protein